MIRSGSTWMFNVCRLLLEQRGDLDRMVPGYLGEAEDADRALQQLDLQGRNVLLKLHNPGPYAERLVREHRAKDLYTHRDPRDVVVSAHRMWNWSIERAIESMATTVSVFERRRQSENTLFVAYDDILARPQALVRKIAEYLAIHVDAQTVESISAATSVVAARKVATDPAIPFNAAFKYHYDPVTLLHKNHVRDGTSGYWRRHLTDEQAARVVEVAAPLFDRLGYQR
jgi:hypothetical protein